MNALLSVILPVFLVIGAGYGATRWGLISDSGIDGLMRFSQGFAIPCLLFLAIANLDLATIDTRLVGAFYTGSTICFALGVLGARFIFGRNWEDAVAIGFIALFSNSLLLGLPITERAFGTDALSANYAIIAVHSPYCYAVGIICMEIVRNQGAGPTATAGKVARGMLSNGLIVGILIGLVFNLARLPIPVVVGDALDFITRAAIPTSLFGLGGVLTRYRPEGDMLTVLFVLSLSLLLHPMLAWGIGTVVALPPDAFRSVVVTAAMAPGVNAYLFSAMYGRAMRVSATAVLVGTALSILTASFWISLLGA